jgi:hypothetical protein
MRYQFLLLRVGAPAISSSQLNSQSGNKKRIRTAGRRRWLAAMMSAVGSEKADMSEDEG